jgi:hypothetical protein
MTNTDASRITLRRIELEGAVAQAKQEIDAADQKIADLRRKHAAVINGDLVFISDNMTNRQTLDNLVATVENEKAAAGIRFQAALKSYADFCQQYEHIH